MTGSIANRTDVGVGLKSVDARGDIDDVGGCGRIPRFARLPALRQSMTSGALQSIVAEMVNEMTTLAHTGHVQEGTMA